MKKLITIILLLISLEVNEMSLPREKTYTQLKKLYVLNTQTQKEFDKLINYIYQQSRMAKLNPILILSTIGRESSFKINAKGINGDRGLCQFTKQAAKYHKVNYDSLYNPYYAVDCCIKRYKDIFTKFNCDTISAINAYGMYKNVKLRDNTRAVIKFNKNKDLICQITYKNQCQNPNQRSHKVTLTESILTLLKQKLNKVE